jgi:hypothetical protein
VTRLKRRRALLICNERYDDGRFAPLPSTQADVWGLRQVLQHRNIGAFVSITHRSDLTADDMRQAISEFLEECEQDELALVYVSGHGARLARDGGEFYFVATDTDFDRVAETGVSAGFVNEQLEQCWAPQKVVVIDCCRSGGFAVGLRTSDRPDPGWFQLVTAQIPYAYLPLFISLGGYLVPRCAQFDKPCARGTGQTAPASAALQVTSTPRPMSLCVPPTGLPITNRAGLACATLLEY